jgi:hypothetical protein
MRYIGKMGETNFLKTVAAVTLTAFIMGLPYGKTVNR